MAPTDRLRTVRPGTLLARASFLAAVLAAPSPAAQGSPFQDGELLVGGPGSGGGNSLWRIDPRTGASSELWTDLGPSYVDAGWLAYDPFRDAVLGFTRYVPVDPTFQRLYRVDADGVVADLGRPSAGLTALTPVGDGRVYLLQGGALAVLDASDQVLPVLDQQGFPVVLPLEHLAYDPGADALIGVSGSSSAPCASSSRDLSVHRLPLDATGLRLAGPPTCLAVDVGIGPRPVGLDWLADGRLLLAWANSGSGGTENLVAVDPTTLAIVPWADPDPRNLDGGVWSEALGAAVVLDDAGGVLRAYAPGESGPGTPLTTVVDLDDGTGGISTSEKLADVSRFVGCGALVLDLGTGLAGTGGVTPRLAPDRCPGPGVDVGLRLTAGRGGAPTLVVAGQLSFPVPLRGGTLYVLPPFDLLLGAVLDGAAGAGGQGSATLQVQVPDDPALLGRSFYFQGVVLDPAAVQGLAFTGGLEVRLG